MDNQRLVNIKEWAESQLDIIMRFWASDILLDEENGGFYGLITSDMTVVPQEPRGLVLAGRMLYAYCKAFIATGNSIYQVRAERAYRYLVDRFHDREYGGAFSALTYKGEVLEDSKPTYSEAFFLMGLSAYYQAFKDREAYDLAMQTFCLFEEKLRTEDGGYRPGFDRTWSTEAAMRFGIGSRARTIPRPEGSRPMFQHHLCQAYQLLYEATSEPKVLEALNGMLSVVNDVLYDPEKKCFGSGGPMGRHSFGHDCEIGYMAVDIARYTKNVALTEKTESIVENTMETLLDMAWGSHFDLRNGYNFETGERDDRTVWWAQAEGVIGLLCGYELTGEERFLDACEKAMKCIDTYFIDENNGDWFNNIQVDENGEGRIVDGSHGHDKLNAGKCPYHNTKMCIELMLRVDRLLSR